VGGVTDAVHALRREEADATSNDAAAGQHTSFWYSMNSIAVVDLSMAKPPLAVSGVKTRSDIITGDARIAVLAVSGAKPRSDMIIGARSVYASARTPVASISSRAKPTSSHELGRETASIFALLKITFIHRRW